HSLAGTARTLTEDASNILRALSWASTLPRVDPERMGIFGVSRGAIAGALVAEVRPELGSVLVLGGADLPGLFRDSHMGVVAKMRRREIGRAGDRAQAFAKAQRALRNVDP